MHSPILTIVSFIIIFTLVVVSHEFGHYLIARLGGIRVKEFSIGMGPALFKKQGRQTLFAIRLLPIGGACIFDGMYGDEPEGEDAQDDADEAAGAVLGRAIRDTAADDRARRDAAGKDASSRGFRDAPVWTRIATVLAGPIFNVLLAYLLALFIVWFCGADLPVLSGVSKGLPAEAAGMQEGDTVISINGHRVRLWREIVIRSFLSDGRAMDLVYERDGVRHEVAIVPYYDEADGRYYFGLRGGSQYQSCDNLLVFSYSAYEVRYWLDATLQSLRYMVSGHASLDDLAGPVGVANVIDDTIEDTKQYGGFTVLLNMVNIAVLLSVNLGVMNMLPIPALDGGRFLMLLFEAVSGRRVPPEKEGVVNLIGFALLMVLMVAVLVNDVSRFFR